MGFFVGFFCLFVFFLRQLSLCVLLDVETEILGKPPQGSIRKLQIQGVLILSSAKHLRVIFLDKFLRDSNAPQGFGWTPSNFLKKLI